MDESTVQCGSCGNTVESYAHRSEFIFTGNERVCANIVALLSCGCEILDYDIAQDQYSDTRITDIIDPLRQMKVLTFDDDGPNNRRMGEDDGCVS